jgi:hypothetical protein
MNPTPPQPLPPSTPKRGTTKKSDKTEEDIEAQGEKTSRPKHAPTTRSVSSALVQAETSPQRGGSRKIQHDRLRNPLDDQIYFPPPLGLTYVSAIDANTDSLSEPWSQPLSTSTSMARSRSPVKSMADLCLAEKQILLTSFTTITQLPLDVRELYKKLKPLSHGEEILPTVIKVSTLAGETTVLG